MVCVCVGLADDCAVWAPLKPELSSIAPKDSWGGDANSESDAERCQRASAMHAFRAQRTTERDVAA